MRILKLDVAGRPVAWITPEDGALLYCREQVAWEAGEDAVTLRGGHSRLTGTRSVLRVNSILAVASPDRSVDDWAHVPGLNNVRLFSRDRFVCLYCGQRFPANLLTRDHVVPVSRGGRDEWENVVTACAPCNRLKGNCLLDEIKLRLLAVPYAPNRVEGLILENRRILADQMAFLCTQVGTGSRLRLD